MAAAGERVFELLDAPEEPVAVAGHPGTEALPVPVEGKVAFDHVRFGYDPARPVIHDFNCSVERPARPWPSWVPRGRARPRWSSCSCASTTSTPAPYRSTASDVRDFDRARPARRRRHGAAGHLALQGHRAREHPLRQARRHRRRGRGGGPGGASPTTSSSALPKGYDTELNEEASNISQGQRQLLTIARAVIADRPAARPRRGHLERRHPHRGTYPARHGCPDGGEDELRDRPPPLHRARRRPASSS